jgi:hypothetical protein
MVLCLNREQPFSHLYSVTPLDLQLAYKGLTFWNLLKLKWDIPRDT